MKLIKLAHPSQVKSVPDNDLDRYLAQGWAEIKQPVNRNARKQREFRKRRKANGQKRIAAYMDVADAAALLDERLPGETVSELLIRLLRFYHANR